ncbi:MAG: recombinase family protein [Gracilibacteraceae bacterium]|jgi:DNA invertase Pin-like site-specific DNA recombinase|nr:recombinase family protein [Gracilibacteraceae bacterium]
MGKTVGYVRVSSKDQNLDRQILQMQELGISEKHIYIDKESGKDFDRIGYRYMKKSLEPGDLLIVNSLDRFGRNYEEIMQEWNTITRAVKADIKVLDMPLLDTTQHKDLLGTFISDLVLQVLSFVAHRERDSIRQRQSEGIAAAKANGVKFGRARIAITENFIEAYNLWQSGEITAVRAMELSGMSKATFYRKVKEYKNRC